MLGGDRRGGVLDREAAQRLAELAVESVSGDGRRAAPPAPTTTTISPLGGPAAA